MFVVAVIAPPIPSAEPRDSVTHPFIRLADENSLSFIRSFVILSLGKGSRAIVEKSLPISVSLSWENKAVRRYRARERGKETTSIRRSFVCRKIVLS